MKTLGFIHILIQLNLKSLDISVIFFCPQLKKVDLDMDLVDQLIK